MKSVSDVQKCLHGEIDHYTEGHLMPFLSFRASRAAQGCPHGQVYGMGADAGGYWKYVVILPDKTEVRRSYSSLDQLRRSRYEG